MSKAFTKENDLAPDLEDENSAEIGDFALPVGSKNYITPGGHVRLKAELTWLLNKERPEVTEAVSWAAGNGDRSENGDYIYGKKRLREIDKRIHFLTKRLEIAEVVDPLFPRDDDEQIFFGATVMFANRKGEKKTVTIVGVDEIDTDKGYISWISPMARALIKAYAGDIVTLRAPGGAEELEVLQVKYQPIPVAPFKPTIVKMPGAKA
jgi:transcription elongation factor GreB